MNTRIVVSLAIAAAAAATALAPAFAAPAATKSHDLMAGKQRTAHLVDLETVVDAPADVVYRLWTTEDGVKSFFAPDAHIDAREGGEYTILFAPDADPAGFDHGTAGAHLLRLVPGRAVWFEWVAFAADESLGPNAPPVAPRSLRDMRPLPTWVEITLDPVPGDAGRTRVRLVHHGFKDGEPWAASRAWFEGAWGHVLAGLEAACAARKG
jgi:uncharacterized protein YndB with AHSA1/START domain